MKFRLIATIATYFLLTLVFSTLYTYASQAEQNKNSQIIISTQPNIYQNPTDKNNKRVKVFEQEWKTFCKFLIRKNNYKIKVVQPRLLQNLQLPTKSHKQIVKIREPCILKELQH